MERKEMAKSKHVRKTLEAAKPPNGGFADRCAGQIKPQRLQ
jgi:hypothetical protein